MKTILLVTFYTAYFSTTGEKPVVYFYNTRDLPGAINPETGQPWEKGEVDENKNTEELGNLDLSSEEEDAIVAFLKTLTDECFEHLMP